MKSLSPSDRERAELRGPVRTIVDDWSPTVFDRDGNVLEWRGTRCRGIRSERTPTTKKGKLIRITGHNGDQLDEFRYDEQRRMTQITRVPARGERANKATGIEVYFEAISEGET